tara:strand:+ start:153 stop:404 length:252 start_codon:yes stop_codon:yes gene_type:complete
MTTDLRKDNKMNDYDYELTTLEDICFGNICEICNKTLDFGDVVRPFSIGGGFMFWCQDCDKKEKPIECENCISNDRREFCDHI